MFYIRYGNIMHYDLILLLLLLFILILIGFIKHAVCLARINGDTPIYNIFYGKYNIYLVILLVFFIISNIYSAIPALGYNLNFFYFQFVHFACLVYKKCDIHSYDSFYMSCLSNCFIFFIWIGACCSY